MATAATAYMATLGPEGFQEVARRSYQNAHYLADRIGQVSGDRVATAGAFFHEFAAATPIPAAEVASHLLHRGILGGLDLGTIDPRHRNFLLLCATETNSRAGIDRLIDALPR
jgi:glycine dehydrogenase subunit 1